MFHISEYDRIRYYWIRLLAEHIYCIKFGHNKKGTKKYLRGNRSRQFQVGGSYLLGRGKIGSYVSNFPPL